jgi:hypothetical protein
MSKLQQFDQKLKETVATVLVQLYSGQNSAQRREINSIPHHSGGLKQRGSCGRRCDPCAPPCGCRRAAAVAHGREGRRTGETLGGRRPARVGLAAGGGGGAARRPTASARSGRQARMAAEEPRARDFARVGENGGARARERRPAKIRVRGRRQRRTVMTGGTNASV